MIAYEEALEKIADACRLLPIQEIPIGEAHRQVLAEDVFLPEDLPPFDNSAMDGYALRAEDLESASENNPIHLVCQETLAAGSALETPISPGTCVKIMTGAPIPEGADAVVPVEKTAEEDGRIVFRAPAKPGANIRRRGEEMKAGSLLVEKGTRIDSVVWGLLSTANLPRVRIYRKPRVALLVTGSELIEPGEESRPGTIRNSNSYTLKGVLRELGVEILDLGVGRDDRRQLHDQLQRGTEADVLITVGGVSAGDFDHIRDLFQEGVFGFEELFYKVRIRPGKPIRCGMMGETLVFGLPGNPVSCLVGYHIFVKPAIKKMWGLKNWPNPVWSAILEGDIASPAPFLNFWRGTLVPSAENGGWVAVPQEKAGSGMLTTFLGSNGFILVPVEKKNLRRGDNVDFMPFSEIGSDE